jgi:hypothetical protein
VDDKLRRCDPVGDGGIRTQSWADPHGDLHCTRTMFNRSDSAGITRDSGSMSTEPDPGSHVEPIIALLFSLEKVRRIEKVWRKRLFRHSIVGECDRCEIDSTFLADFSIFHICAFRQSAARGAHMDYSGLCRRCI